MKKMIFGILALVVTNSIPGIQGRTNAQDLLKVGDKAPDFDLQGLGKKRVKLSERFGPKGHPVVLLFSRASW